ncbi:uncharacterized protein PAC_00970 [Phialocephala subalpina]|uniref:BTB domain-containing protein n=1 Tax=Phialocephala subalpina TaxID=576137 RepID=A0A1L7WE76_9HELO|nr:uncharacterized protein PAC_00970 [Phialocephala subalpina]
MSQKILSSTAETLDSDIVTLLVGFDKHLVSVHRQPLSDRCEYFSKAFDRRFQEATIGMMELGEDDPVACRQFLEKVLCLALFLAHKYCIGGLENEIMDRFRDYQFKLKIIPNMKDIDYVYKKIGNTGKLRQYGVAALASKLNQGMTDQVLEIYVTLFQKLEKDFSLDMLSLNHPFGSRIYTGRDPRELDGVVLVDNGWGGPRTRNAHGNCFFHIHISDEETDCCARHGSWGGWGPPPDMMLLVPADGELQVAIECNL